MSLPVILQYLIVFFQYKANQVKSCCDSYS